MFNDIKWLIGNARRYLPLYILSLFYTTGSGLISLVDPLLMRWVIDRVIPGRDATALAAAGCGFLLAYGGRLFFGVQGAKVGTEAAQRLAVRLRFKTLRHLQRQSSAYHDNTPPGQLVFRLEQDVEQIGRAGEDLFSSSFRSTIFLVLNLAAMFMLNARLAVICLPLAPVFVLVRYRYRRLVATQSDNVQTASAARSSFLQEQVPAIAQSQLLCNERAQARRFLFSARRSMIAQMSRRRTEMLYSGLSLLVMGAGIGLMLVAGGFQVMSGILTVGGLVAFWGYLMRLFEPIAGLIELDTKLQRIRVSVRRVREVLETPSAIENPVSPITLERIEAATVHFENVSFTYQDGRIGIESVSFAVDAGERVAIVGRTGSGKSTITRLLARLYDVQKGSIEVDGFDIRSLDLRSLRSSVLVVPQEPILFEGSFRDNLLCGRSAITPRKLEHAVEVAELVPVLSALRGGWNEQLGPRATKLSGGERQRVALARAILREPRMLVLDESTSALDASTEERVLRNLTDLAGPATLLFVTHNPVVMKSVDRIIFMTGGRLVDEGSHREVSLRNEMYRNICESNLVERRKASSSGVEQELTLIRASRPLSCILS
ncbi:MAG TPA: ABC transporter ATP-binding protein [Chthoniobacterales bacterium]|nr:ABC transporter ATP-binding protein [Chthoniobacterales bacterium]